MENQTARAPRRTRRSVEQWDAILKDHAENGESVEQLAARLGCAVSTIENQLKRLVRPPGGLPEVRKGFVEVQPAPSETGGLTIRVANGATVTFESLPPPEYLAAALGLVG